MDPGRSSRSQEALPPVQGPGWGCPGLWKALRASGPARDGHGRSLAWWTCRFQGTCHSPIHCAKRPDWLGQPT